MTPEQEKELAEIVLKTRRWAFRAALPAITDTVRQILAEAQERQRGANIMIDDYRRLIASHYF